MASSDDADWMESFMINMEEEGQNDELFTASCHLVCEWSQKLLDKSFTDLRELAEFLVSNSYVNSKSMSAFTVIAAMQESRGQSSKGNMSQLFTNQSGGNKHRETQLQLQRKLQERELMKEQKRRLQQQKSEIEKEQEQLGKGGNNGGQDQSAPTTPTQGRSVTTPVENLVSPAKSSSSCSPNLTPTRAESLESRRPVSEMEFLSPVVIRDSYRRRSSQSGSEKGRRKKEKEKVGGHACTPSDLEIGATNTMNKLERNLFPSSNENDFMKKTVEKDMVTNSKGFEVSAEWKVEAKREEELVDRMDTQTSSVAQKYVSQWNQTSDFRSADISRAPTVAKVEDQSDRRLSQVPLKVPLGPSRSAFVPFQQRILGSQGLGSPVTGFQSVPVNANPSITTSSVHVPTACIPKANLSKGLARLLLSKPTLELNKTMNITNASSRDTVNRLSGKDCGRTPGSVMTAIDQRLEPLSRQSPNCVEKSQAQKNDSMRAPSSSPNVDSNPGVTSPLTPRRTKTRFTPIRPKAPAPRTVSSMLREQRGPGLNMEGVSFGNKPVAEILKEKREREISLQPVSPASGSITTILSPTSSSMRAVVSPAFGTMKTVVSPASSNMRTVVSPAFSNMKTVVSPASSSMRTVVSPAFSNMKTVVSPASSSMKTVVSPACGSMRTVVSPAFGIMKTGVSPASSSMRTLMSPTSGSMPPALSKIPVVPKIAIPAQMPIVNSGLQGKIDACKAATTSSKTSEMFIIVGASPTAGTGPSVSSVKPRRSNTISIPIVEKDIAAQLRPKLQGDRDRISMQHSKTINMPVSRETTSVLHQVPSHVLYKPESNHPRGYSGLSDLVHNQNDDQMDKMETEDSSGSALDTSATSKRKRKSPGSFKELPLSHTGTGPQSVSQTPVDDDSVIFIGYSSVKTELSSEENNPKRSKSCLPQLEHKDQENSPEEGEEKSSICPDITSLESDALLDVPLSAAEIVSSLGSESGPEHNQSQTSMKTASVGVTSRSMKLSHKLIRQSLQLDKRIDTFLKQRSSHPKCNVDSQAPSVQKAVVSRSPADLDVMSNLYQDHAKYGKSRTVSDTKLGSKRCPAPEKPVSTVHRGVVQTSNSFVVKKPLASKRASGSRDHYLLKLLSGDSSSTQKPLVMQSHELPAIGVQENKIQQNYPVAEEKGHMLPAGSTFFDDLENVFGKSDALLQDMDVGTDTELPSDVADFITESMEKRSSSGYLSDNGGSLSSTHMTGSIEDAQMEGQLLSRYEDVFPHVSNQLSDPSAEILSSQIPPSHLSQDSLFTVPSVPLSAQRDPRTRRHTPVQRSVSVPLFAVNRQIQQVQQQQQTHPVPLLVEIEEKPGTEHITYTSTSACETVIHGNNSHPVLHRLNSNERHGSQTPISDAGYHSFDSSPVHSTTPLPVLVGQHGGKDPPFLHQSSDQQHVSYQTVSQSPLPYPSPKEDQTCSARSTPMSVASPHQTLRSSAEPSPVEHLASPNGFMPIAVSCNPQSDTSLINPIKPMVTLAASAAVTSPYCVTMQETIPSVHSPQMISSRTRFSSADNSSNIGPIRADNSLLNKLPSYQDAVLSLQRHTPTLPGDVHAASHQSENQPHLGKPLDSSATLESMISQNTKLTPNSTGKGFEATISPQVFPFSYQLSAMLKRSKSSFSGVGVEEGSVVTVVQDTGDSRANSSASDGGNSDLCMTVSPGTTANDQVEFQSVATLIKHYHANSRQQAIESRSQSVPISRADLVVQVTNPSQASTGSVAVVTSSTKRGGHFDLPDARYMGSTPNVDIRQLSTECRRSGETVKQSPASEQTVPGLRENMVMTSCGPVLDIRSLLEGKLVNTDTGHQRGVHDDDDGTFLARRNLSQMLGSDGINENDLQTTLDDLKSLDTQYFNSIPFQASFEGGNPDDLNDLRGMDLEGNLASSIDNQMDSQST